MNMIVVKSTRGGSSRLSDRTRDKEMVKIRGGGKSVYVGCLTSQIPIKATMKRTRPKWSTVGVVLTALACNSLTGPATTPVSALHSQPFRRGIVSFLNEMGQTRDFLTPTASPSESPGPSPSPSAYPSPWPSHSPAPTLIHTGAPTDTYLPTPSPSAYPSASPTYNIRPTPLPTEAPITSSPTWFPLPIPTTSSPTFTPSIRPSPRPSSQPYLTPDTMSPTVAVTFQPSIRITLPPSRLPSPNPTPQPVTPPINLIFPMTQRPSLTQEPSTRNLTTIDPSIDPSIGSVPVSPFEVLLAFENPLDGADVQDSASELQSVLADYLLQNTAGQDFPPGVEVTGFDLSVKPTGSSTRSVTSRRRYVRNLQAQSVLQVYSYNVNGTANVISQSGENVDEQSVTKSVESSVNDALAPENDAALSAYIQSYPDSNIVSTSVAASADTQPPVENSNSKPSIVAIVFGFLLVGLALLSLLFYALTCWKGYKKKAAQRKRERQGVHAVYPKFAATAQPSPQKHPVQPQAAPGFLASSTIMPVKVDSSDDGSSYEEVESESDSDKGSDAFARELKLAASLDKRAWEDYQRKLKAMEQQGLVLGKESEKSRNAGVVAGAAVGSAVVGAALYNSSKEQDDEDDDNEGFEVEDAGSTLIIGPTDSLGNDYRPAISGNTFPYGDEESRRIDPPGPRSSSIQPKPRRLDDPSGFRVSQIAMISPIAEEGFEYASESFSRSPLEDYSEDSYDPAVQMMESLTANTSSFSVQAKEGPRPSPTQSAAASFQSSQAVQMSQSSSQNKLRGSPTNQSGINVVKPIPPTDDDNTEGNQPSKDSNSLQSLLTIDIVREVQKLASFVKKYEMKREKDKMKEAEREERAARSVGDSRSVSVSYDILSEGAASTGRVVMSTNVIGASDNASMSESSQSDWSSDGDYGPTFRNHFQKKLFTSQQQVPVADDDLDEISSVESDDGRPVSAQGSDDSRLGIHPFNVQQIMAAQPDVEASRRRIAARLAAQPTIKPLVPKPVSKPPVTGKVFKSTVLSPIPGTPETNDQNNDESPAKPRAPLDVISRNVASMRTPELRKPVRNSTIQSPHDSPETIRKVGDRASPGGSPRLTSGNKQANGKLRRGSENELDESHNVNPDKMKASERLPPKRSSRGQKKLRLNTLRKHDAILDEDPDIMSALAPSDEDLTRENLTRPGAESPLIKNTPRKSKNSGFNNIISMFESKPKEAIFPPNENWQYNY